MSDLNWTCVHDELPEEGDDVLAWAIAYGSETVWMNVSLFKGKWHDADGRKIDASVIEITHWAYVTGPVDPLVVAQANAIIKECAEETGQVPEIIVSFRRDKLARTGRKLAVFRLRREMGLTADEMCRFVRRSPAYVELLLNSREAGGTASREHAATVQGSPSGRDGRRTCGEAEHG